MMTGLSDTVKQLCYDTMLEDSQFLFIGKGKKDVKKNHVWVTAQPQENYRTAHVCLVISSDMSHSNFGKVNSVKTE